MSYSSTEWPNTYEFNGWRLGTVSSFTIANNWRAVIRFSDQFFKKFTLFQPAFRFVLRDGGRRAFWDHSPVTFREQRASKWITMEKKISIALNDDVTQRRWGGAIRELKLRRFWARTLTGSLCSRLWHVFMPDQWVKKHSLEHLQHDFLNEKGVIRIKEEKFRLPVDVRGSKTSVLN